MEEVKSFTCLFPLKPENEQSHLRKIAQIRRDRATIDGSDGDLNSTLLSNKLKDGGTSDGLLSCEAERLHPTSLESICSPSQGVSEIN